MTRRRWLPYVTISALLAVILLMSPVRPARGEEEDSAISLVKTIEVQEFENLQFNVDEYKVERGDSLAKILRKRGVVGRGPMPAQLLRLVKALNKDLADPNLILPDQSLVLPSGPIEGLSPKPEPPTEKTVTASLAPPTKKPALSAKIPDGVTPEGTEYHLVKVEKGDRLAELLRREGLSDKQIFDEYVRLTIKLNPSLTDPDRIYTGMTLKVPYKSGWAETAVASRKPSAGKPSKATSPAKTRNRPQQTARVDKSPPPVIIPPPELPPSKQLAARTALGLIFTRMGERFIAKGQHFLPLRSGGQITISTRSFPIIELESGQRIILDLDNRLPKEMVEMIRTNWSNYTIFRPHRGEKLKSMLGRLLESAHYFRIRTKGEPWIFTRGVEIRIAADWIIWPRQEDWVSGHAVVITLPSTPSLGTSPELAEFLSNEGVRVIDFHPKGNLIGPAIHTAAKPAGAPLAIENLTSNNQLDFIQAVLNMVGQNYETDLSIPLLKAKKEKSEFNLTVTAPLYFSRGGRNYVVAVNDMPQEMQELLRSHHFELIAREPGETPHIFAQRLLDAMKIKTESGLTIKASRRNDNQNIQITMPGLLFQAAGKEMLLTSLAVPPNLAPLINRPNLRVVHYRIANPS